MTERETAAALAEAVRPLFRRGIRPEAIGRAMVELGVVGLLEEGMGVEDVVQLVREVAEREDSRP